MGNWGNAGIWDSQNKENVGQMRKSVCVIPGYDKKVVVYEFEIRYASKVWEQKLITCLSNTLSFIITMAQNFVRKSTQKNFELDYTFLAGSVN